MTVQIYYKNKASKKISGNLILFVNEKFDIKSLKNDISMSEISYISELLKTCDLKKNIHVFELNSKRKIILVSIKKDSKNSKIENLGAELYSRINNGKNSEETNSRRDFSWRNRLVLCFFSCRTKFYGVWIINR